MSRRPAWEAVHPDPERSAPHPRRDTWSPPKRQQRSPSPKAPNPPAKRPRLANNNNNGQHSPNLPHKPCSPVTVQKEGSKNGISKGQQSAPKSVPDKTGSAITTRTSKDGQTKELVGSGRQGQPDDITQFVILLGERLACSVQHHKTMENKKAYDEVSSRDAKLMEDFPNAAAIARKQHDVLEDRAHKFRRKLQQIDDELQEKYYPLIFNNGPALPTSQTPQAVTALEEKLSLTTAEMQDAIKSAVEKQQSSQQQFEQRLKGLEDACKTTQAANAKLVAKNTELTRALEILKQGQDKSSTTKPEVEKVVRRMLADEGNVVKTAQESRVSELTTRLDAAEKQAKEQAEHAKRAHSSLVEMVNQRQAKALSSLKQVERDVGMLKTKGAEHDRHHQALTGRQEAVDEAIRKLLVSVDTMKKDMEALRTNKAQATVLASVDRVDRVERDVEALKTKGNEQERHVAAVISTQQAQDEGIHELSSSVNTVKQDVEALKSNGTQTTVLASLDKVERDVAALQERGYEQQQHNEAVISTQNGQDEGISTVMEKQEALQKQMEEFQSSRMSTQISHQLTGQDGLGEDSVSKKDNRRQVQMNYEEHLQDRLQALEDKVKAQPATVLAERQAPHDIDAATHLPEVVLSGSSNQNTLFPLIASHVEQCVREHKVYMATTFGNMMNHERKARETLEQSLQSGSHPAVTGLHVRYDEKMAQLARQCDLTVGQVQVFITNQDRAAQNQETANRNADARLENFQAQLKGVMDWQSRFNTGLLVGQTAHHVWANINPLMAELKTRVARVERWASQRGFEVGRLYSNGINT